ncbi:MAG: pyrroline-5-carboxylate reductase [Piptocephalis tieghemiana]|nr:MAG: pyrroline-5-carboxylate reductase [Piptocephalis tieghemiana]
MSPASQKPSTPHVTFIGGGNMAEAIFSGMLSAKHPASQITIVEPFAPRVEYLKSTYPNVRTVASGEEALADGASTDLMVLAVKPQVAATVIRGFAARFRQVDPILLSVAAGIRVQDMERWLIDGATEASGPREGWNPLVVRTMPNTPALVSEGAIGVYGDPKRITSSSRQMITRLLNTVAPVVEWVDEESLLDAITGISGSAPAYFFLVMEAIIAQGVAEGLDPDMAARLTAQTCLGAAKMCGGKDTPGEMRVKVTSPGGTTAAALNVMQERGLPEIVKAAVAACRARGTEMGEEFGKQ